MDLNQGEKKTTKTTKIMKQEKKSERERGHELFGANCASSEEQKKRTNISREFFLHLIVYFEGRLRGEESRVKLLKGT